MAVIIRSVEHTLAFASVVSMSSGSTLPFYGSVEAADNYFALIVGGERWSRYSREKKIRGLVSATKRINLLNFVGVKADADQRFEFPRGTDTLVPVAIEEATYELGLSLLRGVDPDTERDNLVATSQAFGQLRSQYDRSSVQPYLAAGIPNAHAWDKLRPYLNPILHLAVRRSS